MRTCSGHFYILPFLSGKFLCEFVAGIFVFCYSFLVFGGFLCELVAGIFIFCHSFLASSYANFLSNVLIINASFLCHSLTA